MQQPNDQNIDASIQELESLGSTDDQKSQTTKINTAKNKTVFAIKTRAEIKNLSPVEAIQYEIDLHKYEADQLRIKLMQIKQDEGKARRSAETRALIIWGRMVTTQIRDRPDRRSAYAQLESWMDQYLTKDSDRELLGFPPLGNSGGDNHN
jgi:hypothetical protein